MVSIVYQFPMGKVKEAVPTEVVDYTFVSIPYGKGKGRRNEMGVWQIVWVSIPYGKGKVDSDGVSWIIPTVSIPYGKGKGKERKNHQIKKSINSLWER